MKWAITMSEFIVEECRKREPLVNDRQKMVIVFKAVQSYFVFTCVETSKQYYYMTCHAKNIA